MAVKLRLRRLGRTHRPYYQIIVADARARRDGRFIEKIGSYDPVSQYANIELNHNLALKWLRAGAQPTDTVRSILSNEGVMLKHHLLRTGKSPEEVDRLYQHWKITKDTSKQRKRDEIDRRNREAAAQALAHEKSVREARAAKIAARRNEAAQAAAAAASGGDEGESGGE